MQLAIALGCLTLFATYRLRRVAFGRPRPPTTNHYPSVCRHDEHVVTFLVPAWNAMHDIEDFIESYKSLPIRHKQLILCAGGEDGTFEAAKRHESEDILVTEQLPGMGKQRALRHTYPLATGEYIYLTDIDCRLDYTVVQPMVGALAKRDARAVTGPIRPLAKQVDNQFVRAQWTVERYLAIHSSNTSSGLRGNNAVVQRAAVDESGAFARDVFSGTDYTMAKELMARGIPILYNPTAEMQSAFPETLGVYVRKQARWIRNVVVLGGQYGYAREVISACITIMQPLIYLLLLLLGVRFPVFWLIAALLLANTLLNRARYAKASRIQVRVTGILVHVIGDLGASIVVLYQLITGKYTW